MHLSKKIPCMSFKAMKINKLTCLVVFFLANNNIGTEGAIGVNWGRQNAQRLIPSMVIDMLLQNNVRDARIYSSRDDVLQAFSGSGINLTIAVFNIYQVKSEEDAKAWVQAKAAAFNRSSVRGVFLGTTSFFTSKNGSLNQTTVDDTMEAFTHTQQALNEAFFGDTIKVNLPHPYMLLKFITKPSEAEFKDEYKPYLLHLLSILRANKSPFCVDLFPIPTLKLLNITDSEFAFPDNKSTYVVTDVNGAVYTDVFMFATDAFAWALEKLGFPDIKILVSQIGWPTDGYPGANVTTAERFYKGLLPMVASSKGSRRPGSPIDVFLHTLMDENQNMAIYGRHWGIYRSNGEPKYKIDLTGQGRDIFPARARGIMRMPKRWCVVDEDALGQSVFKLKEEHDKACVEADCTSTFTGGLVAGSLVCKTWSYAFNMVFQRFFQDETKCYQGGIAKVVTDDPSTGTCVFPVEVVKGIQDNLF